MFSASHYVFTFFILNEILGRPTAEMVEYVFCKIYKINFFYALWAVQAFKYLKN